MKKIGLLFLSLVLVLGTLGVGYAMWWSEIAVTGHVATGTVQICFQTGSEDTSDPAGTLDRGCLGSDSTHLVIQNPPVRKDVGQTDAVVKNCSELDVTVQNAYPYYYAAVDFAFFNTGTIPVKLWCVVITDDAGNSTTIYANGNRTVGMKDSDGHYFMVLWWGCPQGIQLEPGEGIDTSIHFGFLESMKQNATLTFSIKAYAVQWNEYRPGPIPGYP